MTTNVISTAIETFNGNVQEVAATHYDGDLLGAFSHVGYQTLVEQVSDEEVIQLTGIDQSGDLGCDGWKLDADAQELVFWQSKGGNTSIGEPKVEHFWNLPDRLLDHNYVENTHNEWVPDLVTALTNRYQLKFLFASNGGFESTPVKNFVNAHNSSTYVTQLEDQVIEVTRTLEVFTDSPTNAGTPPFQSIAGRYILLSADGDAINLRSILDLVPEVEGTTTRFTSNINGRIELRAIVPAISIKAAFRQPEAGFRIFDLNPRGRLKNSKPNKAILNSLNNPLKRKDFHLFNNGITAVCISFDNVEENPDQIDVKGLQIVNGQQTTRTFSDLVDEQLTDVFVDLKLIEIDWTQPEGRKLAQEVSEATNTQSALKPQDYAAFDLQQQAIQKDFDQTPNPWYYEIKPQYWNHVLNSDQKARFKTGGRKRHVGVQAIAQASIAMQGRPGEAFDRIRHTLNEFSLSEEDRDLVRKAFPSPVRREQLLLPYKIIQAADKATPKPIPYSKFHVLYQVSQFLHKYYDIQELGLFSYQQSKELIAWVESPESSFKHVLTACIRAVQVSDQTAKHIFETTNPNSPWNSRTYFRQSFLPETIAQFQRDLDLCMGMVSGDDTDPQFFYAGLPSF